MFIRFIRKIRVLLPLLCTSSFASLREMPLNISPPQRCRARRVTQRKAKTQVGGWQLTVIREVSNSWHWLGFHHREKSVFIRFIRKIRVLLPLLCASSFGSLREMALNISSPQRCRARRVTQRKAKTQVGGWQLTVIREVSNSWHWLGFHHREKSVFIRKIRVLLPLLCASSFGSLREMPLNISPPQRCRITQRKILIYQLHP